MGLRARTTGIRLDDWARFVAGNPANPFIEGKDFWPIEAISDAGGINDQANTLRRPFPFTELRLGGTAGSVGEADFSSAGWGGVRTEANALPLWSASFPVISILDVLVSFVNPTQINLGENADEWTFFGLVQRSGAVGFFKPKVYNSLLAIGYNHNAGGFHVINRAWSGGFLRIASLNIQAVANEWHRWTLIVRPDFPDSPGFARIYLDGLLLNNAPLSSRPIYALYPSFALSCRDSVIGTALRYAHVLSYQLQDADFLPITDAGRLLIRTKKGFVLQDDYDRANSNTVGNGWSEVEAAAADLGIDTNQIAHLVGGAYEVQAHRSSPAAPTGSLIIGARAEGNGTGVLLRGSDIGGGLWDAYIWVTETFTAPDRWTLYRVDNGAGAVKLTANAAGDLGAGARSPVRVVVEPSGANLLIRCYAAEGSAALALKGTHTDTGPLAGTSYGIRFFSADGRVDDFYLCGRNVVVRGLQQGWTVKVGSTSAVADAFGIATVDVDAVSLPAGSVTVVDASGKIVATAALDAGDVWGGDEYVLSDSAKIVREMKGLGWDESFIDSAKPDDWFEQHLDGTGAITHEASGGVKVDNSGGGDFAGATDSGSSLRRRLPFHPNEPFSSLNYMDIAILLGPRTGSSTKLALVRKTKQGQGQDGVDGTFIGLTQNAADQTQHAVTRRTATGAAAETDTFKTTGSLDGKWIRINKRGDEFRFYYENAGVWTELVQDFGVERIADDLSVSPNLLLAAGAALGATQVYRQVRSYGGSQLPPVIAVRGLQFGWKAIVDETYEDVEGLISFPQSVVFPLDHITVKDAAGTVKASLRPEGGIWLGDSYNFVG